MTSIADSDAYFNPDRCLAQHQAALVLLQRTLIDPTVTSVEWLDLACGRGQILVHLKRNYSVRLRQKINYTGYDINNVFVNSTLETAEQLEFATHGGEIGELNKFTQLLPVGKQFDFITLTNAVHEIPPFQLPEILFDCISRLSDNGCLFLYDMDSLSPLELKALPLTADETSSVLEALFAALGCQHGYAEVGEWKHTQCNG